jgi:molybdopterin converting factor small subunit
MLFRFSGSLLRFTEYRSSVPIDASTVGEALERLVDELPAMKPVLYDRSGQLRATQRLFLNQESLDRDELTRGIGPADQIDVLTAVSGG